jgi:dienelactone hydrolase
LGQIDVSDLICQASAINKIDLKACDHQGLVGELLMPKGVANLPAIMVLGGSDGGIGYARSVANEFAAQGYAALALAYFKEKGLPRKLIRIPLEYFSTALDWLKKQPRIDPTRIGIFGASKGAEAALLVASRHSGFVAVVAAAPSDVAWEGIDFRAKAAVGSSWSEGGKPVTFIPYDRTGIAPMRSLLNMYRRSRYAAGVDPGVLIPVERIPGSVLFLSGQDDGLWPSQEMADCAMVRLEKAAFAHEKRHVSYPAAGHAIFPLFRRRDRIVASLFGKLLGGATASNHSARMDAWQQTLGFFERSFLEPPARR